MPVTFTVANHSANQLKQPTSKLSSAEDLLRSACPRQARQCKELLQSSVEPSLLGSLHGRKNGFVQTVIEAYNTHHNLIIRPDDVWIAILSQLNFFVNANAEKLRSKFVAHEGKRKLVVSGVGNRDSVDFGALANCFSNLLHENLVDKNLAAWVAPSFSTTTVQDTTICTVMMMSTLKAYFDFGICLMCGIPSVTLEGIKSDWETILSRLDKLNEFGEQTSNWAGLLKPIIKRFISAFDGKPDIDFWSRVAHFRSGGSGPTYLSGWITAFCVFSEEGEWQGRMVGNVYIEPVYEPSPQTENKLDLRLDGIQYPILDSKKIPAAYCEVDIDLDDNGQKFDCTMVSGLVGLSVSGNRDTVKPAAAWFIYIKSPEEEVDDAPVW